MGNLLGSPITEKETHVGTTLDSHTTDGGCAATSSPDGGGMEYGVSSMQGWRVHMEDAHITQPFLYAQKLVSGSRVVGGDFGDAADRDSGACADATPCKKTAIEATLSGEEGGAKVNVTEKNLVGTAVSTSTDDSSNGEKYVHIPLPNHSLFAVFDGHGGSFAAEYAARNLLRVLTRDATFCEYAEKWRGREAYREGWQERNVAASKGTTMAGESTLGETHRGSQLHKRGREGDEKMEETKQQIRKHLEGGSTDVSTTTATTAAVPSSNSNDTLEFALATYDQELMTLLEKSLSDAFINLDAEILREVRGEKVPNANLPYGLDYALSRHSLHSAGSHSPHAKAGAATDSAKGNNDNDNDNDNDNNISAHPSSNSHPSSPHPTPQDDEDSGTTAVVVLITPRWIVCANAGDSRAVYSRSSHRAVPLSYDHKPEDEGEERRIREAGGYVSGGRVEGDLAVSRGFGDFRFKDADTVLSGARGEKAHQKKDPCGTGSSTKLLQRDSNNESAATIRGGEKEDVPMMRPSDQKVSPEPDIIVQNRNPAEDEFIVICCDGIWDVQTNQECVKMVADIFAEGEDDLGLVCEEILDMCLIKGSKDNMTAAVVKLPKQAVGKGGGVMARRERREASSAAASNADTDGGEQGKIYNSYSPPHGENEESGGNDDE